MLLSEKQEFIKNLNEKGIKSVKSDIRNEMYDGEYLRIAKNWIKDNQKNSHEDRDKMKLFLKYLSIAISLIIAIAAIFKIVENVST